MKFSSILESKQVGELYHFTSLLSLLSIVSSNVLRGGHSDVGISISFTRNRNFLSVSRYGISGADAIFVIDGDLLSNRYRIRPYHHGLNHAIYDGIDMLSRDESEERVDGTISNISKYTRRIVLIRNMIDRMTYRQRERISTRFFEDREFTISDIIRFVTSHGFKVTVENYGSNK